MAKEERFEYTKKDIIDHKLFFKFQQKYPEHDDKYYPDFKKAIRLFHKALCETIVEHRDGVELPESLGCIFVGSCWAPKKKNVDFNKTKKYGKVVYHNNYETDGYLAKIFYTNYNNKYSFHHRELWEFEGCRNFRKLVVANYIIDFKKYTVVDPTLRVNKLFESRFKAVKRQRHNEHLKQEYNEFDLNFDEQ